MGHVPDDLREWTQSVLPATMSAIGPTGRTIEIYAPELSPGIEAAMFRWVDRTRQTRRNLSLARGIAFRRQETLRGVKSRRDRSAGSE